MHLPFRRTSSGLRLLENKEVFVSADTDFETAIAEIESAAESFLNARPGSVASNAVQVSGSSDKEAAADAIRKLRQAVCLAEALSAAAAHAFTMTVSAAQVPAAEKGTAERLQALQKRLVSVCRRIEEMTNTLFDGEQPVPCDPEIRHELCGLAAGVTCAGSLIRLVTEHMTHESKA